MGVVLTVPLRFNIVKQHPPRWRFQVVKLPTANLDDESDHGDDGQHQGNGQGNVKNAHDLAPVCLLFPAVREIATTVSELIGIRTAAISGLIQPTAARAAPKTL